MIESPVSSATVALAAEAYGVEPARIAKTLSLRIGERVVLIVASGTSRMDNKNPKARFESGHTHSGGPMHLLRVRRADTATRRADRAALGR